MIRDGGMNKHFYDQPQWILPLTPPQKCRISLERLLLSAILTDGAKMQTSGWRGLTALIGLVAMLGCTRKQAVPVFGPKMGITIAVMEFQVPENITATKEIKGWWFGSHDVLRNPNMGRWVSDRYSRALNQTPNLTTVPRVRIKYYFADKTDLIKSNFSRQFNDQELLTLLYQAPADRFGQELETDYILRGKVNDCYTGRNRTIDTYWSYIDLSAEMIDSRNGTVVWSSAFKLKKRWHSQLSMTDLAIQEFLLQMDRDFFLKQ